MRSKRNPAFTGVTLQLNKSATLVPKKAPVVPKPLKAVEPEPIEPEALPEPEPIEITVDEYLARVEGADSLYGVLALDPDCSVQDIRRAYFMLAKLFHPDHFHRAESAQLRRIENAFTRLAQAYETLKNSSSRKTYDSNYKRDRAEQEARREAKASGTAASGLHADRAAQEFEHGRKLLMEGQWEEALPFLARAVHFSPNHAAFQAFYGKALSNDESQRHKAVNAMQKAVTLEPQNAAFRMILAEYLVTVNLVKRAEGELNRLLSIQPDHKEALALLDTLSRK